MQHSYRLAITVSLTVLMLVSGCSITPEAATTTTLGEVPAPHKATCDLAIEVDSLGSIARLSDEPGDAVANDLYAIAAHADVVGTFDPWARHIADYANTWGLLIERLLAGEISDIDIEELSAAEQHFETLLGLCETQ